MADIQFEDTQEIQVLQDKSQQLAHLFGMDRAILREVQSRLPTIGVISGAQDPLETNFMSSMVTEADIQMSRIDNLLKRLEGTIALVSKCPI